MSTFVMNTSQRIAMKAVTDTKSQFLALLGLIKQTIENSSFAVIEEIPSCHSWDVNWKYKQLR